MFSEILSAFKLVEQKVGRQVFYCGSRETKKVQFITDGMKGFSLTIKINTATFNFCR